LFVLIREMTADKVLKEISAYGGVVLKASLGEPRLTSPAISPFAVIFAVFFWSFMWGISGAFIGEVNGASCI
jgi:predicted PurR-regulated permease PerM